MSFSFDPLDRLIIVRAELWGPNGTVVVQLALDTGATTTLINSGILAALGYDPAVAANRVQIMTGSGIEYAPRLKIEKIASLGREIVEFTVLATRFHRALRLVVFWV
jgi:hypothetical protein